jgi:hypothetical protein
MELADRLAGLVADERSAGAASPSTRAAP